jgi:hypothetical protein
MKSKSAEWAAIGIRTLAKAKDFRPFAIHLSNGENVERLLVPHPSCIGVSRDCRRISWEHGANGKRVFEPRFVLKIVIGIEDLLAEPSRHIRNRKERGVSPPTAGAAGKRKYKSKYRKIG